MMPTGSWYVLCRRERLIPLEEFAPRLANLRETRLDEVESDYVKLVVDDTLTAQTATIEIFVDDEPHVLTESRQFAEVYKDRPDHDAIAAADLRYAIIWDLPYSDQTYNTRCVVAEILARATGGIVYDITAGSIVWSALVDDK
jgi:hypothetical protein